MQRFLRATARRRQRGDADVDEGFRLDVHRERRNLGPIEGALAARFKRRVPCGCQTLVERFDIEPVSDFSAK